MRILLISTLLVAAPAAAAPAPAAKPAPPPPAVVVARIVEVTDISVSGGIDRYVVSGALDEGERTVRDCYDSALAKQPKLSGTETVKFRIDANGAATKVSATGVAAINACVISAIKALTFPVPSNGACDVTEKLVLQPSRPAAGILGSATLQQGGAFASLTGSGDVGNDDSNIYGGLVGNEVGELNDGFGYGPAPADGTTGWGTIGTGRYGAIGNGTRKVPSVSIGQDTASSDPDKDVIRRYVRKNLPKVQYCYEKELLADSKLAGTVTVKFRIEATGKVSAATGTGLAKVDTCVAAVIAAIEFPRPSTAAALDVSYPFIFKSDDAPGLGYGVGGGRGGMRGRTNPVPTVSIGQPTAQGDLDKAIIRRYIKRNIQKIQYCYEKQLLNKPTLVGTVQTQFTIGANGLVTASTATGVEPDVATCIADVIKGIEFPKPKSGGNVQVSYPFTFRPAGYDDKP